jgi:2-polyprenyl-3-methyl-5-hydroxy-6-metoxy-1,4-benzoquinol methylase
LFSYRLLSLKEFLSLKGEQMFSRATDVEVWEKVYSPSMSSRAFEFVQRERVALNLLLGIIPLRARILDVGCGPGHTSLSLAASGYDMVCVDVSDMMLHRAREHFSARRLEAKFVQSSADEIPMSIGKVDGVIALGVMDYVSNLEKTIAHLRLLLRDNGCCILSFSNKKSAAQRIEMPVKRFLAHSVAVDSWQRVRDSFNATYPRSLEEIRLALERTGYKFESANVAGCGIRFCSTWFPPRRVVAGLDSYANQRGSKWSHVLARTLIVLSRGT